MPNPLLLLHGAIGSRDQMAPLAEALRDHYTVYTPDFPGHGGTPGPERFSMENFAGDTLAFMDAQGLERADFFGFSMGGYVALTLALLHPDRVGRIITLGTKWHWDPDTAERETAQLQPEKIREKVPRFAAVLAQRHGEEQWAPLLERTAALLRALGAGQALQEPDFRSAGVPVHILLGSEDVMVSREESERAAAWLPRGNFRLLDGVRHPIEQADVSALAAQIRDLLA